MKRQVAPSGANHDLAGQPRELNFVLWEVSEKWLMDLVSELVD